MYCRIPFTDKRCTTGSAVAVLLCAVASIARPARGDEPDLSAELPRVAPVEAAEAVATIEVKPGFAIEQVAAEPLVTSPVAMAFDARSRLYVVEMRDYSEDAEGHLGRVRLLADTDGDGHFDTSSLFAEGLSWPTAVICYDDGIFVGAAPDILYLKDTDGDGRADVTRKVFTGFSRGNVQGLVNSFAWGLDNRIHGATSSAGGVVRRADDEKAREVSLSGRDFAFDPRTLDFEATSGGAQHGMSFDNWGRKFVCSNSDHIQLVMFEDRYIARNPYLTAPSARLSIAADGPQAEVYRISPVEPWRLVRTRLRVAGEVPGPIEGGGRASGYFTSATGITIYRGNAWPAEMAGVAIVGDVGSNLVHRKRLDPKGLELVARRIDERSEFVASRDIWFRPVQFANAPDGTLYVADMYREVIEHPLSLPPLIKKHLDLTSGRDRGRIYRIVPAGFKQEKPANPADASTAELVATLARGNGWHRDTAARLLYERQDRAAIAPLEKLSAHSSSPEGRMHALHALAGLNALRPEVVLARLDDADPHVRQHAVRLAEGLANGSGEIRQQLFAMAESEPDPLVRYQLLFSLGEVRASERSPALATLARRDGQDRWVRLALLSSLADGTADVFTELANDEPFRATDAGAQLLAIMASQAGAAGRDADISAVLVAVESLPTAENTLAGELVRGLSEGLARHGGSLDKLLAGRSSSKAAEAFVRLLAAARETAIDEERPAAARARAVAVLALGPTDETLRALESLLGDRQPPEVQLASLAALGHRAEGEVASIVLNAWPSLSPRLRSQAAEALFARVDRLQALLDAIEADRFKASDLEPARVQRLLAHPDKKLRRRAGGLLAASKPGRRADVVDAYRPALELKGDPAKGKQHFQKVCAACHRVEGVGYEIGANLATFKNRGPEAILTNVLDPNREVNPQYVNYVLSTDDGRTVTGMIDGETATSVTLKRAEGATDTILRVNIVEKVASGLSIMPEGLEQQLDKEAMADLIAYLMSVP
ncbi:MAG: c-type cytochrome [Planctomycetia bacterium]|nr:c-type cytochrome [Planctomycetia bacterium]